MNKQDLIDELQRRDGHRCPECGAIGSTSNQLLRRRNNWTRRDGWTAGAGDALAPAESAYEKRQATRAPTMAGDVGVPFAQALICALAGAIVGGLLGGWKAAAIVGALAFVVAWLALVLDTRRLLLTVERITRTDLTGDGVIGPPKASPPIILHAQKRPQDAQAIPSALTRDVSDPHRKQAQDLAEFITRGHRSGFALRAWTGRELSSGTQVTDGTWRQWTRWLRDAGILESDKSGTRLTVPLDDALRSIIADWRP